MATTTPRIGLTKPDGTDLVDIAVLNTNFDKIDSNIASTKIQSTKPTTANAGDLWWDSDTGTLYLYYVDANSSQWVAATSDPINIGVVANQTERDAQYPTPAQGMSVYRTDLGVTQRYYGLFNSSTNPGGRDSAGWYDTEKSQGLVPIIPTSVTASGTGYSVAVNSMGQINANKFEVLNIAGAFSAKFKNYKIKISNLYNTNGVAGYLVFQMMKNGVATGTNYNFGGSTTVSGTSLAAYGTSGSGFFTIINISTYGGPTGYVEIDLYNPFYNSPTAMSATGFHYSPEGWRHIILGGNHDTVDSYDGIKITNLSSGLRNAAVSVYGYNE